MWGSRLLLAFVIVALAVVATGFYRARNSEGSWKIVSALEQPMARMHSSPSVRSAIRGR